MHALYIQYTFNVHYSAYAVYTISCINNHHTTSTYYI